MKCTQLFPLARKEFTENRQRSKFGTIRTSSSLSVPRCITFLYWNTYSAHFVAKYSGAICKEDSSLCRLYIFTIFLKRSHMSRSTTVNDPSLCKVTSWKDISVKAIITSVKSRMSVVVETRGSGMRRTCSGGEIVTVV